MGARSTPLLLRAAVASRSILVVDARSSGPSAGPSTISGTVADALDRPAGIRLLTLHLYHARFSRVVGLLGFVTPTPWRLQLSGVCAGGPTRSSSTTGRTPTSTRSTTTSSGSTTRSRSRLARADSVTIDFQASRPAVIDGTVVDSSGSPSPGRDVQLYRYVARDRLVRLLRDASRPMPPATSPHRWLWEPDYELIRGAYKVLRQPPECQTWPRGSGGTTARSRTTARRSCSPEATRRRSPWALQPGGWSDRSRRRPRRGCPSGVPSRSNLDRWTGAEWRVRRHDVHRRVRRLRFRSRPVRGITGSASGAVWDPNYRA